MAKESEKTEKIEVKDFKEVPKTEAGSSSVKLNRGEVLVSEVDDNGKEINQFATNQATFDAFFSKNKKFSIKKK